MQTFVFLACKTIGFKRLAAWKRVWRVFWATRPSNTGWLWQCVQAVSPQGGARAKITARCGKVSQRGFSGRRYYLPMAENYGPANTLGVSPARPNVSSFESVLHAPKCQRQLWGEPMELEIGPAAVLSTPAADKLSPAQKCIRSCISEIRAPLVIRRVSAQIRIYYLPASVLWGCGASLGNNPFFFALGRERPESTRGLQPPIKSCSAARSRPIWISITLIH